VIYSDILLQDYRLSTIHTELYSPWKGSRNSKIFTNKENN